MASCTRNQQLVSALETPKVMQLRRDLHNLLNQIPCSRDGQMMGGAPDAATMAKVGTVCIAIAVAVQGTMDVQSAMAAQCSAFQLTAGLIAGSGYCTSQATLLATSITYAVGKVAAAGTAIYAATKGGKKRRRKSGRRKSNKKKSNKKRKKRTHRRR
tara:strand:- start:5264 stop:5734 length:471 start_codon:yes stop_codon:yes gene_type:complete